MIKDLLAILYIQFYRDHNNDLPYKFYDVNLIHFYCNKAHKQYLNSIFETDSAEDNKTMANKRFWSYVKLCEIQKESFLFCFSIKIGRCPYSRCGWKGKYS